MTARKRAKYVSEMGMLYRMTATKWRKFCKARLIDGDAEISDFGTLLAYDSHNVTDWKIDDYKMELEA